MEKKKLKTIIMTKDERIQADPRASERVTLGSGPYVFVTRQTVEEAPTTETAESDIPAEQLKPWWPYEDGQVFDAKKEFNIETEPPESEAGQVNQENNQEQGE
jgi:hypothetical protein